MSPGRAKEKPATGTLRRYRREIRFLVLFLLLLGGGFAFIAWNPINDHVIEPFTAGVASSSGFLLNALGQEVRMRGTQIYGERFAVDIRNGCNAVETLIIFVSAILSFPASWRSRLLGLVVGAVAIQALNLVRVVALFLTGSYFPTLFNTSHTVVWQSIVIFFGVLLWIFWANRFALRKPSGGTAPG